MAFSYILSIQLARLKKHVNFRNVLKKEESRPMATCSPTASGLISRNIRGKVTAGLWSKQKYYE